MQMREIRPVVTEARCAGIQVVTAVDVALSRRVTMQPADHCNSPRFVALARDPADDCEAMFRCRDGY